MPYVACHATRRQKSKIFDHIGYEVIIPIIHVRYDSTTQKV